jgi:hypothetical protein
MNIVLPDMTPLEADLTYPEHPVKILYQKGRVTAQNYQVLQGAMEQPYRRRSHLEE